MASASIIDVPRFIDERKISRLQLSVLALCAAVIFMDGFDAQAIGYVAPSLGKAWGLPPGTLGPVFGAGLFGLMLGALIFGPLADRTGRKSIIILCAAWFGVCSLLTVAAFSLSTLLVIRFLTGVGLGGVMPNAIALTSEYGPRRSRATMVTVMFCGFSLGSALGGVLAAKLIPAFGWPAVFWAGGILPLALVPLLAVALPESLHVLVLKGTEQRRIGRILSRIDPTLVLDERTLFVAAEERRGGFLVRHLFEDRRGAVTALLWIMFFMNLLDLYFLANWLPTVINGVGLSVEAAVIIGALFQVGGTLGTLSLGWLIDQQGALSVLGATFVMGGLLILAVGSVGASPVLLSLLVFAAGFCVVGAQIGANALAATFYPTFIRSTGVGWALGIGRIGSIIGPVLAGVMLSVHWTVRTIFLAGAVPQFCAALAIAAMALAGSHTDRRQFQ